MTEVRPTLVDPAPPGRWVADRPPSPPWNPVQEDFWDDHWHDHRRLPPQGWVGPPLPPPAPRVERARGRCCSSRRRGRGGRGVAAFPYLVIGALLLLVWLLRSGSMTASATGDRQRLRGGTKWYDVVVAPLSAPWHLRPRRSRRPSLLFFWAGGFAVAAGLLCYAFSVSLELTPVRQRGRPGRRALPRSGRLAGAPTACRGLVVPLSRTTAVWALALAALLLVGARARPGVRGRRALGAGDRSARRLRPGFRDIGPHSGRAWHDGLVPQYRIIIT